MESIFTFDATAGDVYYHAHCYVQLSNSARAVKLKEEAQCQSQTALPFDPLVLAEIVSIIQIQKDVVKLSDIKKYILKEHITSTQTGKTLLLILQD